MDIDRHKDQGGVEEATKRVAFCLNKLEKARAFKKGLDWNTDIVTRLSIEEVIGALVAAEQVLKKLETKVSE